MYDSFNFLIAFSIDVWENQFYRELEVHFKVEQWIDAIIFAVIGLYVYTRPRPPNDKVAMVVLSGLIMQIMLLYLKGYSPQFILWFLPLIILVLPDARGLWYAFSFAIVNALEYPLYFTFWKHTPPILVIIILARTILWILLAFEYWGIYRGRISTPLLDEATAG